MNTDDPIFDAIEAHRRARAETSAAFEDQSAIENQFVAGGQVPPGEAENDSQWVAANAATAKALAVQDDLAVRLLETQPTTIAGAAALLIYYADVVATPGPEIVFPEFDGDAQPFKSKSVDEPKRNFGYFIVRHVAAALTNMAPAGEASEQHGAIRT
jgi:hypothetical protein